MNKPEFTLASITDWHAKGYKGEGVTVVSFESDDNHGANVKDILQQVAPETTVIAHSLPTLISNRGKLTQESYDNVKAFFEWVVEQGASIVTMSVGKGDTADFAQLMRDILLANGIICFASAGNDRVNKTVGVPEWTSVGAVILSNDGTVNRASYSLADVLLHGFSSLYMTKGGNFGGTSCATPFVAGQMALYHSWHLRVHGKLPTYEQSQNFIASNLKPEGFLFLPDLEVEKINNPEYIIIHHSATANGSVDIFRKAHRDKGWSDVGYHYVIGNGTQSGDGVVEKGRAESVAGAHAQADGMNFKSIGICLVGNFNTTKPTLKQMVALETLVTHAMERYKIPSSKILGHGEVPGAATACPGSNFDMVAFRKNMEGGAVVKTDYDKHWAKGDIEAVKKLGLMSGYSEDVFKPDQPVTRGELAAVVNRLYKELV